MSDSRLRTRIATELLKASTSKVISNELFKSSAFTSTSALTIPAGVSDANALASYKKSVGQALSAVNATTSEKILDKFSKDPRMTVKRAVADNLYTSSSTLEYLFNWAANKYDATLLESTVSKVPLEAIATACLKDTRLAKYVPWNLVVSSLKNEAAFEKLWSFILEHQSDFDLSSRAFSGRGHYRASGYSFLLAEFLIALSDKSFTNLTMLKALAALPDKHRALHWLMTVKSNLITKDIAEFLLQKPELLASEFYYPSDVCDEAFDLIFANGFEGRLFLSRVITNFTATRINRLIDFREDLVLAEIAINSNDCINLFDVALANKFASFLLEAPNIPISNIESFLTAVEVPLASDLLVALLQKTSFSSVDLWLTGDLSTPFRPGDIKKLFADPKDAFRSNKWAANKVTIDVATLFSSILAQALSTKAPYSSELIDSLKGSFFQISCLNPQTGAAKYLEETFLAEFGENWQLWELALGLMPTWEGSLNELLEICLLSLSLPFERLSTHAKSQKSTPVQLTL